MPCHVFFPTSKYVSRSLLLPQFSQNHPFLCLPLLLSLWPEQGLFSRCECSKAWDRNCGPCLGKWILNQWATREAKLRLSVWFSNIKHLHNVMQPSLQSRTWSPSRRETLYPKTVITHPRLPHPWSSPCFYFLPVSVNLSILDASRKWHHTIFVLLCPRAQGVFPFI